ncbi:MAG TPA: PAS domain S-box protein [Prolixibacteraceae bacterium]|nr:PAS domain S-box protein [Prolixibacteraceae bacterium]
MNRTINCRSEQNPDSPDECKKLIYELKARQLELELSNQELIKDNNRLKNQLQKQVDFHSDYLGRLILSQEGIILEVGQNVSNFIETPVEQLKGNRFVDFLNINSLTDFENFLINVFKFQLNDSCKVTLNTPFNTPVTVQIYGILSSNRAECFVSEGDFTIPIKNSSLFPESEMNYNLLHNNLNEGIAIIKKDESLIYINSAGELIFGEPFGKLKNRNLKEYINSEQILVIQNKLDNWKKEEKISIEINILTPQGENKVLNVSCLPYIDSKGIRLGTLLIFIDRVEKRKTHNKLNEKYSIIHRDLGFILEAKNTINQALFHIIHSMLQIEEIHAAGVYLISQQTGELELIEHNGFSSKFIDSIRQSILKQVYSHSVSTGVPVYGLYSEIFEDFETFIHEDLNQFGIIPIKHEGKIIGSVIIASNATKKLKHISKVALETIAVQIGGTIARMKSKNALKLSQKNFQLIFETINDFTFILDAEGKIIIANPVVEQSLGYTQKELQRMLVFEIHPPERHNEVVSIFDWILTDKSSFCSVPLKTKNGRLIPVETKIVRGKWDGKDAIYCISRDITERQKAEAKLKMQSIAFEAFTLAIIITDIDGNIQWANSSFSRLSDYTMTEIIGKKPSQLVKSGKQDSAFYKNMWNTILSGNVWSGELINKRKNGSFFPEELRITPIIDHTGAITSFIAIKIDITRRKEMEVALKLSEERWHFALEASGDSMWDWNLLNNKIFFSDQGKIMLGYSVSEIENNLGEWEKRVHPDDLKPYLDNLNKYLNDEVGLYMCEYRMRCKEGNYIWVHDRGKIIEWTTKGKPLRIIGTHKDITDRKLREEQLKRGIEKEKELNDLKSRFVATTSHEFRTPLASILMISDTLIIYNQKMSIAQISARLVRLKKHVLHLTDIVNNVLQLSKIQEGKIRFNPQKVDLIALCHHIIDGFNSGESHKNQIRFNTFFKSIVANVDDMLIVQAINNLISNAIKYSPEDSLVNIEVTLGKNELLLLVQDNGIGIPEKDLKHLFTPFFRAGNASTIQGNGLGLSIVRESLLSHGGKVSCSTSIDKGSTFILHFPLELISTYNFKQEN